MRGRPGRAATGALIDAPALLRLARADDEGQAEYARKRASPAARSLVALEYQDGILLVAENLHPAPQDLGRSTTASPSPVSAKYNEFENLRIAGVRHADLRGYSLPPRGRDREGAGQRVFAGAREHLHRGLKPFEWRCSSSRWPTAPTGRTRCTMSSTTARSRTSAATRRWAARRRRSAASSGPVPGGQALADAVRVGIRALTVTQNKDDGPRPRVAVLDQKRRAGSSGASPAAAAGDLGRPDPPEGGRPMGPHEATHLRAREQYGLTCTLNGQRQLSPDNVARYLFEGHPGRSQRQRLPGGRRPALSRHRLPS